MPTEKDAPLDLHSGAPMRQGLRELLKVANNEITRLSIRLKDSERRCNTWRNEFELYRDAWIRALGGKLCNKRHLIDALVKTTKELQENFERYEAIVKADEERAHTEELARTFGVTPWL